MSRLLSFRRVKHATPAKMRVLAEDLPRASWLDRLSPPQFIILVSASALVAAIVGSSAANPENTRAVQGKMSALAAVIAERRSDAAHQDTARPGLQRLEWAIRPKAIDMTQSKSSGCHPSYSGCLPIGVDVDCVGGKGNGPAFTGRVAVIGPDVYGLDRDGDGIGCE